MTRLDEPKFRRLLAIMQDLHGETLDPLERPRHEHFERVAVKLLARNPDASDAQIEAAILHDVLTHERGGRAELDRLGIEPEAIRILERIVPPPNANYFSDIARFTDADNKAYICYIRDLVESGDRPSIEVKLADIDDTVELLSGVGSELTLKHLANQYKPSQQLLEAGLQQSASRSSE